MRQWMASCVYFAYYDIDTRLYTMIWLGCSRLLFIVLSFSLCSSILVRVCVRLVLLVTRLSAIFNILLFQRFLYLSLSHLFHICWLYGVHTIYFVYDFWAVKCIHFFGIAIMRIMCTPAYGPCTWHYFDHVGPLKAFPHLLFCRICMNIMSRHQCVKETYFKIMRANKDHRVNSNLTKLQIMSMQIPKF